MMNITLKNIWQISSKKFYEIVVEKQHRLIPTTPEEFIISKYLKGNSTVRDQQLENRMSSIPKPTKPTKIDYQQILQRSPHGSIIENTHKNVQLNLVSLNFRNIHLKDIYEVSLKFNPDLLIVQGRPEDYLTRFQLFPRRNGIFSDKEYFKQLVVQPEEIIDTILSGDILEHFETITQGKSLEGSGMYIRDTKGPVEDEILLMVSYFAARHKKPLLFGEMPEQAWRQWICNSHTLMQVQQIFKSLCKNYPFYESLGISLERLACFLNPQIFNNLKDRYLGTLIEMAISQKMFSRIMMVSGTMENEAVHQVLSHQLLLRQEQQTKEIQFTPILQYLIGPPIKSSILRNVQGWEVIEKQIILDVMRHGEQVVNIPIQEFITTNKIIEHYGRKLNKYGEENIMKFRHEKTLKYLDLMRKQITEGVELRKKFMMREAIRQSENVV